MSRARPARSSAARSSAARPGAARSRRAATTAAALGLSALLLAGCSDSPADNAAAAAAGTYSATDWGGTEITLDAPAERVVCLDGTCIDALAELDLLPVASVQLDQVQNPYFFGPDAQTTALGSTFFEPDLEGIIAAEPDLVIGSLSVHGSLTEALGDIPFYGQALTTDADAVDNLRRIATLTDRSAQAEDAIMRYEETLAAYGPRAEADLRPTTVLSMYGGATDDIGIDALDSATGRTIARYTAYPWPNASEGESGFLEIGIDTILEQDPAYIFVLDFGFDPSAPALLDQLAQEPLWSSLSAVREGHVIAVDDSWWGTTAGTRGQQLVLDTVLPTVYPEEFPEPLGVAATQ